MNDDSLYHIGSIIITFRHRRCFSYRIFYELYIIIFLYSRDNALNCLA